VSWPLLKYGNHWIRILALHCHSSISFLREDSLARVLTLSNVHPGSNMVVMETTQGFLTGALLERMGGETTATLSISLTRIQAVETLFRFSLVTSQ